YFTLNRSFDFLLPKLNEIPFWIYQDADLFIAFFAGYVDSEGSFFISQGEGHFEIRTSELTILEMCRDKLELMNVRCSRVTNVNRLNSIAYGLKYGIVTKKKMWRFSVGAKDSLLRLIDILSPHLRHSKRLSDLERVK